MKIIKRDGTKEEYSKAKMLSFLGWACSSSGMPPQALLEAIPLPKEDTHVAELLVTAYRTAEQLTSRISTGWLLVAGRIYMVDLFKQHRAKGIDLLSNPPSRELVASMHHNLTNLHTVTGIKKYHNIDFDYSLPISDVKVLVEKQARLLPNGLPETPSLVLMRQAIDGAMFRKEGYALGLALRLYQALKAKKFTHATPMAISAGRETRSTGSCVLMATGDTAESISQATKEIGLHSKSGAGIGIDVSEISGKGRIISSSGSTSNGVKPFLKIIESTLAAYNQGGKRKGSGIVTFRWWHIDFEELIYLKNNKGLDEQRIRGLKYSMVTNAYLYELCDSNSDAMLVCPDAALKYFGHSGLVTSSGYRFEELYKELMAQVKKGKVKGKIVKARWIMSLYVKNAFDHGHLYQFYMDNANEQNMLNTAVLSSNLCSEVMIPSKRDDFEANTGLCFLNSTNINAFYNASEVEKTVLIHDQVKTLINQINTDHYAVPNTSRVYNKANKFIGVGMSNLATLFAEQGISYNSQEALELMDEVTEDWSFQIINASMNIAREYGPAPEFDTTKWAEGILPIDLANSNAGALTQHQPNHQRWEKLRKNILKHGLANTLLMAIAPTASSASGAGLSEGIEPIIAPLWTRTGSVEVTACAHPHQAVLANYTLAFDTDNRALLELAAVRQKWIDQGQSINLYVSGDSYSMAEAYRERRLASTLGLKSLYYIKFQKGNAEESICESCT
jgi:ribonucleoside-diphosphate reductase alpha chain